MELLADQIQLRAYDGHSSFSTEHMVSAVALASAPAICHKLERELAHSVLQWQLQLWRGLHNNSISSSEAGHIWWQLLQQVWWWNHWRKRYDCGSEGRRNGWRAIGAILAITHPPTTNHHVHGGPLCSKLLPPAMPCNFWRPVSNLAGWIDCLHSLDPAHLLYIWHPSAEGSVTPIHCI